MTPSHAAPRGELLRRARVEGWGGTPLRSVRARKSDDRKSLNWSASAPISARSLWQRAAGLVDDPAKEDDTAFSKGKPMFERGRLFVLIVLLTSFGSVAAGASPTASPETPPADPCATAVPALPNDLTSAFAYEIQSVSLLHFLSQIKRVPERDQKEVFDNVAAAAKTAGRHELEVAEQSVCPNLEQIYGQTRALILVANEWTPRELHDDDKFSEFAQLVGDAVTALVFGDKLTDDQRRLALRPFGSPAETGASLQSDGTTGRPCLQPVESARTLHAVPPNYPALAGVSGTTGRVEVLVS